MNENYIVTQANNLIEARHNNPLTSREQKIILTMVSKIEPIDEDFKDYYISIREFSEMLGLEGSAKYTELKEITRELMSKTIEIPQSDGGWLLTHWLSSAKYINGEGIIELSFSPKLKPYLLQLKNQFTSYRLSNILSLNSTYSIRFYELMKKWQHLGRWEITVVSLREKVGAIGKSYLVYGNFKNKILLPAIKELNKQTDLLIDFKETRKGRKVMKIEFTIKHCKEKEITINKPKKEPEQPKLPTEQVDILHRLNKLANGYSFDQMYFTEIFDVAKMIWEDKAESELEYLIRYVNEEDSVKSPLGFIKAKLREAWNLEYVISFADLKPSQRRKQGRTEMIPDWLNNQDEQPEIPLTNEQLEKRQKLIEKQKEMKRESLVKQGFSPKEIEKRMK